MKRFAEACDRNQTPILEVLKEILPDTGKVLEIGSGTGQHAAYFRSFSCPTLSGNRVISPKPYPVLKPGGRNPVRRIWVLP